MDVRQNEESLSAALEPRPGGVPTASPPARARTAPSTLLDRLERFATSAGLDRTPVAPSRPAAPLDAHLRGREQATAHGPCYLVEQVYEPHHVHGDRVFGDVLERLGRGAALMAGDAALGDFDVRRALFLDLETTGLSCTMGTLAFLIGTAHFRAGRLILEQWLLRTPEEEAATLTRLAERLAEADWLVTFNGRTFDLPLLRTRFAVHRMGDPSVDLAGHLDLLHASRRLLRHGLPDCRLATIEARRLSLTRVGDIPGHEVPASYVAWLHGEDPGPLLKVVAHNRDDVLSMVTLLDELLRRVEQAEAEVLRDPECGLRLADLALKIGDLDYAERVFATAAELPGTAEAGLRGLARVRRRLKKREQRAGSERLTTGD